MKPLLNLLVLSGCLTASIPAVAQYDGGASQMLGQGMGYSNMSSSTLRNAYESTRGNRSEGKRTTRERDGAAKNNVRNPAAAGNKAPTGARKGADTRNAPVLRSQADVDKYMSARMAHHARALAPEYKRRAARDGTPAADAWIKARGYELGKIEGERARKLMVQD